MEDFQGIYKKLSLLDSLVFLASTRDSDLFTEGQAKVFSVDSGKTVKVTNIQYSINKLIRLRLITKMGRGEFVVEKPSLQNYVGEKIKNLI